ncbi:sporulation histidine kinase inhibitor Sda [Niallia circulans]|uniref:sporulation histidine kinase inhibitor Sda n=1 Tax=Niallia circulans TaxID=1397 RepID=UPI000F44E472|nr:sporulation histidine kinase inhibitor Sda [Niallia circulans]AYV68161.1 sporulation histidine kinase inhibitor Sda [Niallia circulans]AYV73459.1 sporulation histidine kinase inhibitor Sda [Niallia circulans]
MKNLDSETLLGVYHKAIELNLNKAYIDIIKRELIKRKVIVDKSDNNRNSEGLYFFK